MQYFDYLPRWDGCHSDWKRFFSKFCADQLFSWHNQHRLPNRRKKRYPRNRVWNNRLVISILSDLKNSKSVTLWMHALIAVSSRQATIEYHRHTFRNTKGQREEKREEVCEWKHCILLGWRRLIVDFVAGYRCRSKWEKWFGNQIEITASR